MKGLIRVGNLSQVTAWQCWEKLGDLFCCEFYLKTELGQTLQPEVVRAGGDSEWKSSVALACTQLEQLAGFGYLHSLLLLYHNPESLLCPASAASEAVKPIGSEGFHLPTHCDTRSQVRQRWPRSLSSLWLQPDSCGSFCFGKDPSKVTALSALFGGCALLLCPSQDPVPLELLGLCIFSWENEWLTFATRSCLGVDWLNLIIILSSNRSKALI